MVSNNYRILNRFSPLVRLALKGFKFNQPVSGGYACRTGRCPMAVAVELSGGVVESLMPTANHIARVMLDIGLIRESELEQVRREADNFILNYSTKNFTWKKYLGV